MSKHKSIFDLMKEYPLLTAYSVLWVWTTLIVYINTRG